MHREHEFVWAPYTDDIVADLPPGYAVGSDLWVARVPLICFHIVEWHLPDRVMRQFGFRRGIPGRFCTSGVDVRGEDLHEIDGRSRGNTDRVAEHAMYVSMWVHRRDYIVEGVRADGPMRPEDPYYAWYRSITRRFVDRTAAVYMSLADVLHQVESLSSDPVVSDLARVGLDIVYEDGRRIPTPRRTPAPRGGRAAPVRGGRAATSSRPSSPTFSPPIVHEEYVFGPSAADFAGPSSRPADYRSDSAATPSMSYLLDDPLDAEEVDAPGLPARTRPETTYDIAPRRLHLERDYPVRMGGDDRHVAPRRDRTPNAEEQPGEGRHRRQPPRHRRRPPCGTE
ncbi:uncharacterized protein LOC131146679 [Malania oleifera]|uniref:uncharacterized protein LOC131146679 n=1 Tax=Malania oleifera TaxID=397392 RepID=UPI0025ADACE2|nr:uncharacterized protein LOC131146679 [Malania oleifera]